MRKLSILVFLMFTLLLSGTTQALTIDVTGPGDAIKGYPDDGDWPAAEAPMYVIDDNPGTKFLHFKGDNETTGFQVTAAIGGKIVTGMTLTTGNDAPERDPVVVEISGSNVGIDGPYTLIATVTVDDFDQVDPWPRNTKNATPITFANAVAYDHYQVLFTVIRVPENGCCMQVSEVELLTDVTPPAGWGYKNIGNPAIPGCVFKEADTWTIRGSGHDVWGNGDGIYYVYRPLSGDGSLQVNLVSMDVTSAWAKVGPAIRQTLESGSKHAMTAMTGGNGLQFVWRMNTDQASDGVSRAGETWPEELRITRAGNDLISEFNYEWLPGLFMWTEIGRITIPMTTDVYIGMVVCATNNAALNTAVLDNVVLTAPPYEKVWDMSPADGSIGMPVTTTLSWMPGDSATSHDVYFGADPAALALVDTKALGDESYAPALAESTTYYWQIVEQPLGMAGPIWSFTTLRNVGASAIDRCIWEGIEGTAVADLTGNPAYPGSPTWCDTVTKLDSPDLGIDNYGGRMQGLLIPEVSGNYTFWVAADDGCELWLSTSEKACEASLICYWTGWTGYHSYDGYAEQKSASIPLVGGEKYFIRALWKEGGGGDHCSVAWEGPDAPSRTEIDGYYLIPGYVQTEADNLSLADGATVTVQEAATVSWKAGATAVSHNVYLGTDPAAMSLVATVAMPDTSAALPGIAVDMTYYIMVEADDGTNTYPGCTQSFSTAEWVSMDVGGSWGGSATKDGDCWTIVANGADIWGNSDQFHFVYQTPTFTRDTGTLIARVDSLATSNTWAKAGVMIRETTLGNSKNVCMLTTPPDGQNLATFQRRADTGGGSESIYPGGGGVPEWVKLVRNGNLFRGYHSEDGVNWTYLGEHTVYMNSFVRVGLAVTSHDAGLLTTCQICDFTISTPDPRQAWNLSPANLATGVNIHAVLTWNAGDGATQHQVYFSEDEEAVVNRTAIPTILPVETTELAVGPLDLTKTYFWCVDELVNPVIPGEVMSFTVENYRTIDDFEAYDVEPEALPEQQLIPGEILVEAVPPPDQAWVEPQTFVLGSDDGPQIVTDPDRGLVLSLDGDGDYVDCGNPAALNFGTVDWTICAWVKNTMTGTGDTNKGAIIANGGDGGGGIRYCLIVSESDEGRVSLVTDDNSKKRTAKSGTFVNDGVWHHVLGLREGGKIRVYIDGVEDASSDINEDLSGTSQRNFLIGAIHLQSDGSKYKDYAGLIDDARVYDYALSADNALFLADKGGTAPATGPIANWAFEGDFTDSSGNGFDGTPIGAYEDVVNKCGYYGPTIVHWAMDEGAGDTVLDDSGNGLDGTIVGAAWTAITADGSAACLDFSGMGDYVVNELAGPYLNYLNGLTISMWIQSDVIDTDKGFIIGRDPEGNDQRGFRYDTAGGTCGGDDVIKYGVATTEGSQETESSENAQTTDWQHILVTWESGVGTTLYINGMYNDPNCASTVRGGITDGYTKLLVGKGGKDGAADAGWDGRIDDVRILDYAVTEGQRRWLAGLGNIALPDWFSPMLGHWKADGDAQDSSGNENHGTPLGDATIVEDAERGLVAAFDGDGDAVNVGNSELFNFADDVTISVWVNLNSWNGSWGNVIVGKRGEGGVGWQLRRFSGENRFSWTTRGMGEDDYPASNLAINMNQWYHLAAVRDGTEKRLYINGMLDSTQAITDARITPCPHDVYIGARANGDNSGPESFYDGKIDELRIYNMALSWPQILTLAEYVPPNPLTGTWSGRASAAPALQWRGGAHEGAKCMRVEYTGSGAVTRLEPFGDGAHPHDWNGDFSLGQAQALSLWFKGDPENAPGTLFAQLTTVVPSGNTQRVLYNGDPEDLMMPDWKEWNISLKSLSTGKPDYPELGLPITKIKDVGVGVIGAGGGVVYFDDLRLQPVRCVPEYGPAKDLNDDCAVDEADLRILIGDWAWQSNPGVPGVRYEYYEAYYNSLDEFEAGPETPKKVGVAANFDITVRDRDDGFVFRFTAKVAAPEDGYYTFYTSSDDGSELYVDGIKVVDNDGLHGMQWMEGVKYLRAGLHDIVVMMFENGGGEGLQVEVTGPGIPRIPIPNEVLFLPDAPKADLNGDGIVNFLDYADILNSYVDEILWPTGGDLL
jgi:hypothetical protein